jgi:DNA polymerase elongation subunit (family B)
MIDLATAMAAFLATPDGRRVPEPKPRKQIDRERHQRKKEARHRNIAVLDMESDPFDKDRPAERIAPFCACLYSYNFEPVIIWNENLDEFCTEVLTAIESLPDEYTIFAHNGGKFDWQFLLYRLRGAVSFKGRGIMSARIGKHHIRDSYHIIPEKLAAYRKDKFDYTKLKKHRRNKHRKEILDYLLADCKYLLEIVAAFIKEHGLKLSIGQAAMVALKGAGYEVENLAENSDAYLRHFYFGGRVECIAGKGEFVGPYKLYDVNSMYPFVMSAMRHPVGRAFEVRDGEPGPNTVFIDLTCTNHGALVTRGPDMETSPLNGRHRFKTTIHEYNVAIKYGLIEDVEIHYCIDFEKLSTFEHFVKPFYDRRQIVKDEKKLLEEGGHADSEKYIDLHKTDIFLKLILNNAYGKFAQNPRKYKESYITDYGWRPPTTGEDTEQWFPNGENERIARNCDEWGDLPAIANRAMGYSIWEKPTDRLRFRNVATAASITGAARAVLLEAICNSRGAIYCDTDSLICLELENTDLHPSRLGAWDLEDTFERVIVAGKKTYACDRGADKPDEKRFKIRSKGTSGMTWRDMQDVLDDEIAEVTMTNPAPTLQRNGAQVYITRRIRATAGPANKALLRAVSKREIA